MSDQRRHDDELPLALRELGEHLRIAAHREYGRPAAAWRRVPRRGLALAAALIVVSVGAATAAGLISVGKPASDKRDLPASIRPNSASTDDRADGERPGPQAARGRWRPTPRGTAVTARCSGRRSSARSGS